LKHVTFRIEKEILCNDAIDQAESLSPEGIDLCHRDSRRADPIVLSDSQRLWHSCRVFWSFMW